MTLAKSSSDCPCAKTEPLHQCQPLIENRMRRGQNQQTVPQPRRIRETGLSKLFDIVQAFLAGAQNNMTRISRDGLPAEVLCRHVVWFETFWLTAMKESLGNRTTAIIRHNANSVMAGNLFCNKWRARAARRRRRSRVG